MPTLLLAVVYHAWLLPGLITGEDFQRPDQAVLATYFPWPSRWAEFQYSGYSLAYLSPSAPLWSVAGGLAQLGLSWNVIERVIWLLPLLILLILGPYLLVYRLTRVPVAAAVATTFFAVNTWTVGLTERGHIPSLLAYALMPLIFIALMVFYERPSPLRALGVAALVTVQSMEDVRYSYITLLVVVLFALSRLRSFDLQRIARAAAKSVYLALFWLVFNLYWLLPLVFHSSAVPRGYNQLISFIDLSSFENLPHAIAMFFPFYHHAAATDGFKVDPVEPWFYAIPSLAVISLAATWRRRWIPALALITAFGVVILAGPNTIIGFVDRFLFVYLPGMFVFRDITKFSSVLALCYALALAFGTARLLALARLRLPGRAKAVAALGLTIGALAYALLMRDAYNPKRLSNFASLQVLTQEQRLKQFLDAQPGYFRTAFYPTAGPYLLGTDHHPIVSIGDVVNAQPFRGLAGLSPRASDPFALWRSPLMPALVRQMNVRFFVIYDDPTGWVYRPFEYNVQRAEAQQFFRRQHWLREAARFGGNVVYRVAGASDAPGFIAPTPLLYDGTVKALDALSGTELWSDRGALVLSSQVDSRAVLPYLHTLVRGPDASDQRTDRTIGYSAVAFTRQAMLDTMFGPPHEEQFKFQFKSEPGPAMLQLQVGNDRHYLGSWSVTADRAHDARGADEAFAIGPSAERIVFGDGFVPSPIRGPGPGDWLAVQGAAATLGLINPTPWSETADLVLPAVVSPDNSMRSLRVRANTNSDVQHIDREFVAFPRFAALMTGGGAWRTIHDLSLAPGITWLVIAADGRHTPSSLSLLLRADVQLANDRFERSIGYGTRHRYMILPALRAIDASLGDHPRLWLYLKAPPLSSARLVLALESTHPHRYAHVSRIIRPGDLLDGEDLFSSVQAALDTMFSLEPDRYSEPLAAFLGNTARGPLEASSFTLRSAWVESVDAIPAQTRQIRVSEFTVGVGPGDIPPWSRRASPNANDVRFLTGTPLISVDGMRYSGTSLHYDPQVERVIAHVHLELVSDSHVIEGLIEMPFGVQSAVLSQGTLRKYDGAALGGYGELSSAEYTGTIRTSGGLLVWPVSYDNAWALAVLRKGQKPTGNIIRDWWSLRGQFLTPDRHVPVNSLFNGWFVPRTEGRVVFLDVEDAISRIVAIIWALFSAIIVAAALLLHRRQRA